ncbi:MAG: 4-hydroxy-4-methyl-2-oxoglutarate aldolase, partial [Burkholderiales bacterium]
PVQSIGRWKVTDTGRPAYMAGATVSRVIVHPGDFILGDADGVIAIPGSKVTEVLDQAEALTRTEVLIRRELAQGLTLQQALDKFGHV